MNTYRILHHHCDTAMEVDAETAGKAKYKNFGDWSEVFRGTFKDYLEYLISCKK